MTQQFIALFLADAGGLFLLPTGLLAIVFWIWMIVDCVKYETEGTTRIVWLLIILLTGIIGAPLYFFLRKAPRFFARKAPRHPVAQFQPPTRVYQPWQKDQRLK